MKSDKIRKIIIASLCMLAAIIGIVCLTTSKNEPAANFNADSIIEPSEETGFITEKILGNPAQAKIIIYEYADFGCSHCAEWNRTVNKLLVKYGDDVALVFRNYNLGFTNGPMAARAATAAHIQGFFQEYKDLLFENYTEWLYEKSANLAALFSEYFEVVSHGSGDIDKFQKDMQSDAVKTRLNFEQSLGKQINLTGTPTFRIDGKTIHPSELETAVEQKFLSR